VDGITVVAVLTTCSAISVNVSFVPLTFAIWGVVLILECHDHTVGLDASTGGVWVEVVIIAVLAVPEAFVFGMDVLEVVLAGNTRVLVVILNTDFASCVLALCQFTVVGCADVAVVTCTATVNV